MPPLDEPYVDLLPEVSDEIRRTPCHIGACRSGINVHLRDGPLPDTGKHESPMGKGPDEVRYGEEWT